MLQHFMGTVVSGHGRGKALTFPTMNLKVEGGASPKNGVYAVRVYLLDEPVNAVMHVGPRPTFHEDDVSIEIHLLNFEGEIHPDQVEVDILGRLRGVCEFDSPEALKKQIEKDIMQASTFF